MRVSWAQLRHKPVGLLLDLLICPPQHRLRDRQAERLGGLDVNHQLELRGLFDQEVSRPGAAKDPVDVDDALPDGLARVGAIRDQAADLEVPHAELAHEPSWRDFLRAIRKKHFSLDLALRLAHGVTKPAAAVRRSASVFRWPRRCSSHSESDPPTCSAKRRKNSAVISR